MTNLTYPQRLLLPIKNFLEKELVRLKGVRKGVKSADPFTDSERTTNNSFEEDVDEQVGHFDAQVKMRFVARQIIQFRKALTRMKIGKYGVCEKCNQMIDTERLASIPEITVCIDCAKERES